MIWYGGGRLVLETFRSGWNWTVGGLPTAMLIGSVLVIAGVATIVLGTGTRCGGVSLSVSSTRGRTR